MNLLNTLWSRRALVLEGLVIAVLVLYGWRFLTRMPADFQWDFKIDYDSAKILLAGGNPYDTHPGFSWEYTYPPMSLAVFIPFTIFPYETARLIWVALQVCALVTTVFLWRAQFLKEEGDWLFYLFCVFAYCTTFYINVRSGNVAQLEQPFIWLAFLFFLRRRYFLFCLFLMVAAIFKGLPLFFLLLLWLTDFKWKHFYFFGAIGFFAVLLGLNYIFAPVLTMGFMENALGHTGFASTSSRYLILGLYEALQSWTGLNAPQVIRQNTFWVFAGGITLVAAWLSLKIKLLGDRDRWHIFFMCMTYALIIPNLGDYAYLLFVPPAYYIFKRVRFVPVWLPLIVLASLTPNNKVLIANVWEFYAVLVAWGVWALYAWEIFSAARESS